MIPRPPRSPLFPCTALFRFKVTVLVPCVAPKFVPVIVTGVPTNPDTGFRLVMPGPGDDTVKFTPLLATTPTVTTAIPHVATPGTATTQLPSPHLDGISRVPL